ncbi:hypothetical protein LAZ67_2001586 [Cordylochernes scorpioides]|uniref:Ig-like domain-containing protein n=1 Tax=Cordylochernes scorpioides TaxID=51811 RepID=A0ABY6K240_9ARAC|nr:hypothetical protein LAZ67_2001586 [Cordylochernes scorpioides]
MPGHRKRRQFKQTNSFTRGMVIGLKRAGWSIRQIAADTHLGASTVHRLWRRWLEQGNVAIYRNVGATRVTSARVDRRILRQAVAAPQATCTAILQHVQDTLDYSISTRTIFRRLVANGLHSCRPLRRLPLTPPNRRQRLEWCRARSTDSRRVRVWRRRGERSNPAAIVERPTVLQRGIMVWGAIAYDSRSPLLRIQGTMTAQRYVDDVLRPVTLPYLQRVPNALYQQDNARPHTARISQQALQDAQMLPWPPYSPDLSPIEHVWDIIGRRLHALPQPRSEDELWQMVETELRAIPQDAIRTLIDSLPRRVAACIAVRVPDITETVVGVAGGRVALPCDLSSPVPGDDVALVLWYKDDVATPLYSLDARRGGPLARARHTQADSLAARAYFSTVGTPARLELSHLGPKDEGEYRCRVDFRLARTRNRGLLLKVIDKPITSFRGEENGIIQCGLESPLSKQWNGAFNFQYFNGGNDSQTTRDIRNEYLRLRGHTLDTITKQAVKFCDDATDAGQLIVTNINCQSLSAHAADIETDTVIPRSDYLVLTETWMRDTCEPTPIKGYECVSRENNRPNSDTNAAGGVAIYRKLSSTSTAEVFQVAITDVTRVIKTKGDMCMTEVTCFAANTSFKFILGAVYIHPGASMQDIGMLLWQGLGPYIHNSQYVPLFVQIDSSIPILLCGDFNKNVKPDNSFLNFMKNTYNLDCVSNVSKSTTLKGTTIDLTFARHITAETLPFISYFSYHRPILNKITQIGIS